MTTPVPAALDRGRPAGRRAVATLVGVAAALAFAVQAHAETTRVLRPTSDAWYQPAPPTCVSEPCDQGSVPAAPLYPEGTLHVGAQAGAETARAYLAFPFHNLTGTITSATLDVPLDITPLTGTSSPDSASVQVCLTSASIEQSHGGSDAPDADCETLVEATYVADPEPHLMADLAPLLRRLTGATGLALVPRLEEEDSGTWRIVFSAHDRADDAAPPPASLRIGLADEPEEDEEVAAPFTPPASGGSGGLNQLTVEAPDGLSMALVPTEPAALPTSREVAMSDVPIATTTRRYPYSTVWLLPLALLVLVPAIARSFTKDLTPAQPTTGRRRV